TRKGSIFMGTATPRCATMSKKTFRAPIPAPWRRWNRRVEPSMHQRGLQRAKGWRSRLIPLCSRNLRRRLFIRPADDTETMESLGEKVIERGQLFDGRDDADDLEIEFVHAAREMGREPALVILDRKVEIGLARDQRAQRGIRKQGARFRLVVGLND